MRTEVHLLRLPRLVIGIVQRCREEERVAIWDDVPVQIPVYSASEAPVAFHWGRPEYGRRVAGGTGVDPVAPKGASPSAAWQSVVDEVQPLLRHWLLGAAYTGRSGDIDAFPWMATLDHGLSRRRGFSLAGEFVFKEVSDDGRALQARNALELGRRIAVVDGALCRRSGLPRFRVDDQMQRPGVEIECNLSGGPSAWGEDPAIGSAWRHDCFRADRLEEAHAYAAALAKAWGRRVSKDRDGTDLVIVAPEALAECYDGVAGEDGLALSGVAASVGDALRKGLGMLPEPEIARYLALRALQRSYDAPGIKEWLEGLDATRAALAAAFPRPQNGSPGPMSEELADLERVAIRFEAVDRFRLGASRDDEASLAGLFPGP
jgi:hypothetical protein